MKQSGKVALGGILAALSLICLIATVFPYATFALPAMAGLVLLPLVVEAGVKWGFLVFGAVGILNLFLTPDPAAKVMFVAFFGYYPALRCVIEKRPWIVKWLLKLAVFNGAVVSAYWLMLQIASVPPDAFELFGIQMPFIFLAFGNVVFVIYDMAIGNLLRIYIRFLQPQISRIFRI